MQIQLLLDHMIKKSQKIQDLQRQLNTQKMQCQKRATNERQKQHCNKDTQNYSIYLQQYKKQFRQIGQDICLASLSGDMKNKFDQRRKCVQFYMKSFNIFENNVRDKLKSLVHKYEYSEL